MKILINERLSEHRCKTPEGYLICTDAILARTGKQTYRKNEIFKDSDDDTEIEVDRTEDEVFSPQTLASFENKPVTVEHPDEDVNVHNYKEYAVGFVRDVHRGVVNGQPVILGNLVITDEKTIQEIENGEHTDLSCGYDCDIVDEPNPCQRNIRGNHVALCECGRAGIARIVDSKCKDFDDTGKNIRVVKEFIEQNGNKFDKRKDADAILEYIKKRTGIANADYGDVLYIIKEYTRAEITDSVKDAKYVIMHPRKNLYLTVGAKTWSDESDPMIKKFDSEKEAEEYAKKNTSDFRIAVFDAQATVYDAWNINDDVYVNVGDGIYHHAKLISKEGNGAFNTCVVKDLVTGKTIKTIMNRLRLFTKDPIHDALHTFEVCYFDNGPVCIMLNANSTEDALRKFRQEYGWYTIKYIHQKDSTKDALIPPTKEAINKFEVLLRIFDITIDRKGLTPLGRVHYQVRANTEFDRFVNRLNRIDEEMDKLGIPMTFNAGSDGKTCTAGIDLDKQYVKDSQKIQKLIKVVKSIK